MFYLYALGVFLYSVLRRILFGRWVWWSVIALVVSVPCISDASDETHSNQKWLRIRSFGDSYTTKHLYWPEYEPMDAQIYESGAVFTFRFFDDSNVSYGHVYKEDTDEFMAVRCVVRRVSGDWLRIDLYSHDAAFNAHAYFMISAMGSGLQWIPPWRTAEVTCEGSACYSDTNRAWSGSFPNDTAASSGFGHSDYDDARRKTEVMITGDWGGLGVVDTPGGNFADPGLDDFPIYTAVAAVVPGVDSDVIDEDSDGGRISWQDGLEETAAIDDFDEATLLPDMATPQLEWESDCLEAGSNFVSAINHASGSLLANTIFNESKTAQAGSGTITVGSIWSIFASPRPAGATATTNPVSSGTPVALAQALACGYEDIIDDHMGVTPILVNAIFSLLFLFMTYAAGKRLFFYAMGIRPMVTDINNLTRDD